MRPKSFRTIAATTVLVGLAFAVLVQSGGSGASSVEMPAETTTSSTAVPATDTTSPAPFTYRIGLLAGVSTTNYWQFLGEEPTVWNSYVLGPTKPALYGVDPETHELTRDLAGEGPPQPVPGAEGWVVEVDLATDASWSDGTPITAGDLVFTFETVRRLGLGSGWSAAFPANLIQVTAPGPATVRLVFSEKPGLEAWPYGAGLAPVMPSHHWGPLVEDLDRGAELYSARSEMDPSGGPLQLVSAAAGRWEAIANPGRSETAVDRVVYQAYPDEASAIEALIADEIDVILGPHGLSTEALDLLSDIPGVALLRSPANAVRYIGFNLDKAPMADPAFRRALALLLDRESVVGGLAPGAHPAYTLLTPANHAWFHPEEGAKIEAPYTEPLPRRLEAALDLLGSAGYRWETPPSVVEGEISAGRGLTIDGDPPPALTILSPGEAYDPLRPALAEAAASTLRLLGFQAQPVITDFDTVIDLAFSRDEEGGRPYDMYLLGWTLGNPALPDYHAALFGPDGPANSTGYRDPGFDQLLHDYRAAGDVGEARRILWAMEAKLASDLPYLPLYHPEIVEAYRSDRIAFSVNGNLGGLQGRLGGIADVVPAGGGQS